jgi:O-antigen/teichoic acid export membrane protein
MQRDLRNANRQADSSGSEQMTEAASAAPTSRRPSLTRQTGALASGALVSQTCSIVLLMGLTRLVPKAQLGAYQQLNLLYGITAPLLVAGIPAALLYFIPRSEDPAQARARVGDSYVLLGATGLASSVLVVVAHAWIADALGNPALSPVLIVYAPFLFLSFVTAVMPAALVAARRAALAAKLNGFTGVFSLVTVLAAVALKPNALHMAVGLVVSQAAVAVVATYAVYRTIGISVARENPARGSRALLRYGVPLALTGLAGMFAFQFDRLVVSRDFSAATYAVYAVGAVELPFTVVVQQAVNAVLVPAMVRHHAAGDIAGMAALWRRAIRRTSLVLLPMFVFFMLTAPETVRLLFGGSYHESAVVFRIYLLLVPLRVATYGIITQAIGRTRINLSASFVLLASNAILVLALVGPLGLPGPALATVLATFGMAFYYLIRLRAVLSLPTLALFPARVVLTNLALSAAAGIPVALLIAAGLHGVIQLVVGALVYAACYIALLLAARRLDRTEIEFGRRVLASFLRSPQSRLRVRPTDGRA